MSSVVLLLPEGCTLGDTVLCCLSNPHEPSFLAGREHCTQGAAASVRRTARPLVLTAVISFTQAVLACMHACMWWLASYASLCMPISYAGVRGWGKHELSKHELSHAGAPRPRACAYTRTRAGTAKVLL